MDGRDIDYGPARHLKIFMTTTLKRGRTAASMK